MATTNKKVKSSLRTHEGAPAVAIREIDQLKRSVMSCLLWEDGFYEDGQEIGRRIADLVRGIPDQKAIEDVAIAARTESYLRHVPLLIARELARRSGNHVGRLLPRIIKRADELAEFLALYWKDGRQPLSAQVKKGLANAFGSFDEYALAKYNRDKAVKLRDVLFLSHAKPATDAQEVLWKRLVDGKLAIPGTWENELSTGKDARSTWERLIAERKLGGLATLRNLRNMQEAGVLRPIIEEGIRNASYRYVLPFRFIAAARYAPSFEPALEEMMLRNVTKVDTKARVVILVDTSGSMDAEISSKSEMKAVDAATGVAMIAREMYFDIRVFAFSDYIKEVPPRHGFGLRDAVVGATPRGGTHLGEAVKALGGIYDLLIVITDEQSHDRVPAPTAKGYMINVASNRNGVGYRQWCHIDGWSDSVLKFVNAAEGLQEKHSEAVDKRDEEE